MCTLQLCGSSVQAATFAENRSLTGAVNMFTTSGTTQLKEKLLQHGSSAHNKLKSKINTDINDPNNENARARTDELLQNPLTGLFLVLHQQKWSQFPFMMKLLWIMGILFGSGIQWVTVWLLYLYLSDIEPNPEDDDHDSFSIQLLSTMMSCVILFIYVFTKLRKAALTLYHYFALLEFSFFHYWILFHLILEILLPLTVTILSVLAMSEQNNISDQLGISLAFFFILELDEWIYEAFIEDFDVLDEEDFVMRSVALVKADDIKQFYHKKALVGVAWAALLLVLSSFVVAYFYIKNS